MKKKKKAPPWHTFLRHGVVFVFYVNLVEEMSNICFTDWRFLAETETI